MSPFFTECQDAHPHVQCGTGSGKGQQIPGAEGFFQQAYIHAIKLQPSGSKKKSETQSVSESLFHKEGKYVEK
jgi:hypothetical protein